MVHSDASVLCLWLFLILISFISGKGDELRIKALSHSEENENGISPVCVANNTLPSMGTGGLIFFLHIPKTGGTTIRRNLEQMEGINYVMAKDYTSYSDSVALVEDVVLNGSPDQSVLFYEVHANTAPSFFNLRHRLQRWRQTALRSEVPVFFFSLVREPLLYSFSHFNFFHLQKRNRSFERCNATEDDFLRKSIHNPQCQFLFKGEPSMRGQSRNISRELLVQTEDCQTVTELLFEIMDWVGTTESLSTETIPILKTVLEKPNTRWKNHRVSKESESYISFGIENVSTSAIETISDMSRLDTILYNDVERRYRYREVMEKMGR